MALNFDITRTYLQNFEFNKLFIEILGWSSPKGIKSIELTVEDIRFMVMPIAQLAGVVVFEVSANNGILPNAKIRATIHKEISKLHHENLLIFLDKDRTQSLWYWVKREGSRGIPREHLYMSGQPGDLFLGKLNAMFVDISDLDENGNINVLEVAARLQKALDVEKTTKKFFTDYAALRLEFIELIQGIENDHDRRWYASVLLNRMMFIYFLQRKSFVNNGDLGYLQTKLAESKLRGADRYYSEFLTILFFEGFAKPEEKRSELARKMLGRIRYLNGGLFLPHSVELNTKYNIKIPDLAFENLLKLFAQYTWNLNDTPGGDDDEINPDVLGYIFEKYINQKAFGAYYTRPEITEYLCEQTIYRLILQKVNTPGLPGMVKERKFEKIEELLTNLDAPLCKQLLFDVLPKMSLLDPACGSGAFLVAAMKTLINIYSAIIGRIEFLKDGALASWLEKTKKAHPSVSYFIKRSIITDNLFGVDIMEEATEIARLRLFLALVASVRNVNELEPLPNIDFNILPGNSLIGMLRVDEDAFNRKLTDGVQLNLFQTKTFRQIVNEKRTALDSYRHASSLTEDLQSLRDTIQTRRCDDYANLNEMLLDEFKSLEIKVTQATWDEKNHSEGKSIKRAVQILDIQALEPFHWGYEFNEVMNERGGFDIIITNPPWEAVEPEAKEFFSKYSDLIKKKTMTLADFNVEIEKLLTNPEVRDAWLNYQSFFSYQREYFRFSDPFINQVPVIDGKRHGKEVNLYKLFLEQCYNLLNHKGYCGIVIPSSVYNDLGAMKLRELLFNKTQLTGLFCFENRKEIFEGVHRSFKFVILTFEKGIPTQSFPAAFMHHNIQDLELFPSTNSIILSTALIQKLSPDSLSVMEFQNELDVEIAKKLLNYPLLGDRIDDKWTAEFHRELNMTDDAGLFRSSDFNNSLPLYEGKMIYQFTNSLANPRFWIDIKDGREALLGKEKDSGQKMSYQKYRLAYRSVAASTNERTLISTIVPPCFTGHSLNICIGLQYDENLYLMSCLNSFIIDWFIRLKVTTNISMFYIYQLPIPRFGIGDPAFSLLVERAAKLICTMPEFDELAKEVGLGSHENGVTDPKERARLRAELDGMIAHLYGLTENEFAHILSTFPIVKQEVKDAALEEFRKLAPDPELIMMIQGGETEKVEFKVGAIRKPETGLKDNSMMDNILEEITAFMNTDGGTLLIGVQDDHTIVGIDLEYPIANPAKQNWDGYVLNLIGRMARLGIPNPMDYLKIERQSLNGKDLCRITVQPAPEPVYFENKFLVRRNSSRLPLSVKEGFDYISRRWPK
jgi:Alw26I/Eco31I/Esp3I family type II restriction m6 adenine DNA methyltransferase